MQTTTSLTFFTAIFVALGGVLAEELMICCRHEELNYIYIDTGPAITWVFWFEGRSRNQDGVMDASQEGIGHWADCHQASGQVDHEGIYRGFTC